MNDDLQKIKEDSSIAAVNDDLQKIKENQSIISSKNDQSADLISTETKISEFSENVGLFPSFEFNDLNEACQKLVTEAVKDPEKQFIVGKSLIEGENNFIQDIQLCIKYIEESVKANCLNSMIHYVKMLIKGNLITQDFTKAEYYLSIISQKQDKRIYVLNGRMSRKKDKYSEAVRYFKEGSNAGESESMFEYGKMLFLGEGVKKND